jgi:uncharacterized protein (DUF1778 family)
MTEKAKKRGGSDTARERGLTGVVAHFSPRERSLIGMAAEARGLAVKDFVREAALAAVPEKLKNLSEIP